MGSRREQGYIPSSAPPTALRGTSLVGETVLGFPPPTPCRASRWPVGPGTLPRLGQSREASSTEGTITWP